MSCWRHYARFLVLFHAMDASVLKRIYVRVGEGMLGASVRIHESKFMPKHTSSASTFNMGAV